MNLKKLKEGGGGEKSRDRKICSPLEEDSQNQCWVVSQTEDVQLWTFSPGLGVDLTQGNLKNMSKGALFPSSAGGSFLL